MSDEAIKGWCSWCFKPTRHTLIEHNYVRRNVYQCGACLNRTVQCRICSEFARGHEEWHDEQCAKCDGTVKTWGSPPAPVSGYCSWCFANTQHKLVQRNAVRRDVHECLDCGGRTVLCRRCGTAFARGHGTYDDECCLVCDGTVKSWHDSDAFKRATTKDGWCSWCFENTSHKLEQSNPVRRNVYSCEECFGRTLPCSSCGKGFARGGPGWDDHQCASCADEVKNWDTGRRKKDDLLAKEHGTEIILAELQRQSEHRDMAMRAGMIRPFLLLASMDYATRNQLASLLGFSLFNQPYVGDPHIEAWDILDAPMQGIGRRCTESWETLNPLARNVNWYETVYRAGKEIFKKLESKDLSFADSIEGCSNSKSRLVQDLENEFLVKLSSLQAAQLAKERLADLDELEDSEEVREIAKNMREAGIDHAGVIRYGLSTVYNAIRMGGFNTYIYTVKVAAAMNRNLGTKIMMAHATKAMSRFAGALNVIGWVWLAADVANLVFGSSHGRAFPAVLQILNQKLMLAAEGIKLEDYY